MSKERPILFSGPMVRAILEGRKTQTRRILRVENHPAVHDYVIDSEGRATARAISEAVLDQFVTTFPHGRVRCPYGVAGDRLWVREAARIIGKGAKNPDHHYIDYRAGGMRDCRDIGDFACAGMFYAPGEADVSGPDKHGRWVWPWKTRASIPRWASRITLEVTGVRVERLRDISVDDLRAEGVVLTMPDVCLEHGVHAEAKACFAPVWDAINGKGSWNANPWVWVLEFKRVARGGVA